MHRSHGPHGLHRRRFLGLTAGALAAPLPRFAAAAPGPAPTALVVTDLTATTDAANLFAVLETVLAAGLPVTCAVSPPGDALDGYPGLLQALLALGPGLEIALDLPALATLTPYFQGRAAFEARRRLVTFAGNGGTVPIRTALCEAKAVPTAPVGVRSAGIRNVLVRPDGAGAARSETWPNGVVRFFGGHRLTPWSAALPHAPGASLGLHYLSAGTLSGIAQADLRRWASRLASEVFEAELAGEVTPMSVSELQLRDDYDFTRRVALRLVGDTPEIRDLESWLAQRGIVALTGLAATAPGYWIGEPDDDATASTVTALDQVSCDPAGRLSVTGPHTLPSGVPVRPVAAGEGAVGLDACAMLRIPGLDIDRPLAPGGSFVPPGAQEDLVLTIHPAALTGPGAVPALRAALETLAQDGITRFVPLDRLANTLLSHGPIERRFRRTRAVTLTGEGAPGARPDGETEALMDDARRAWAFFERFTDPNTGLCPATANVYTGGDALTWVTMWDVGSQINALVAAHGLGLVETAAFEAAARRILYQIAGRRAQGRLLPHGVIRTDLVRRGSSDFDGCDAGRLLAALDNLRRHSDLGDEIAALVASWDLEDIILDGAIHSVTGGELKSTFMSHCAHYAARAFARWGLTAGSPYRTFDGRAPADGEMALMEVVAKIGPLGAEPLLLEALELGMSPESAWLAEVLHVAQVEEYEATGDLVAVSEMPIQREPWFIYLGLQLGRLPREWALDVVDGDEKYRTRAFLEQNMALSTKAAFLWAAYRPGPYAQALVAYVRQKARLPIGFASNVGRAEGGSATSFTDLNTNAIILEAIAAILAPHPVGDDPLPD